MEYLWWYFSLIVKLVSVTFTDVSSTYLAWDWMERLYNTGIIVLKRMDQKSRGINT
jgi:hypothetical protein